MSFVHFETMFFLDLIDKKGEILGLARSPFICMFDNILGHICSTYET